MKKKTIQKKRTPKKQKTFLSLFIIAALAITIGIPLTLKLNSQKNSSQKVAEAVSTAINIRSLTTSQSYIVESSTVSCAQKESFISTYKVGCWNKPEVTRNVISTNLSKVVCVSITQIAQDADSYCRTQAPSKNVTPTYKPNNPWDAITPVPARKTTPTPTPKRSSVPAGRITSIPKAPTRTPTPAPIKGVVWE